MKKRSILISSTFLGIGSLIAFADHIPTALSYVGGEEIFSEIVFFSAKGNFGVPAYAIGTELEPHDPVSVSDGDSITIGDSLGGSETITLSASDFADPPNVTVEEVLAVIDAQSDLASAYFDNSFPVIRGELGGDLAEMHVTGGTGTLLDQLGIVAGTHAGSNDVQLVISTPADGGHDHGDHDHGDDHGAFADHDDEHGEGHPFGQHYYLVLASATDGWFDVGGQTVHIGYDGTTAAWLDATFNGLLPGFLGKLDANGDAVVNLDSDVFELAFGGNLPDKLHFAYLVFNEDFEFDYASNTFSVDFQ